MVTSTMRGFLFSAVIMGGLGWAALLPAQEPRLNVAWEVPLTGAPPSPALAGPGLLTRAAAERAMETGFPEVAARLFADVAATPGLTAEARQRLGLDHAVALIESGELAAARAIVDALPRPGDPRARLRRALADVAAGDFTAARSRVEALPRQELPEGEWSWWHYLRGALADEAGEWEEASREFAAAAAAAGSALQRARFELADLEARLGVVEPTESQAAVLRQNFERFVGRRVGYDYGRQYAAALHALGRGGEAQEFLLAQLRVLPGSETAVHDEYQLLLALIAGPRDAAGRAALTTLLRLGADPAKQRIALQILLRAGAEPAVRGHLKRTLEELLRGEGGHPIEEDLRLVRAQLARQDDQLEVAEMEARTLLDRFPGSALRPAALGVGVGGGLERGRFSAAAAHATEARADLPAGQARAELGVLQAEAFFRAGDFRSAANAYAAALIEVPAGMPAGRLMFQQILAEIAANRLTEAGERLDVLATDPRLDGVSRWQAEWNLARALQAAERAEDALARLDRLLAPDLPADLPALLAVRLAWLQARLALGAGEAERALNLTAALQARLGEVGEDIRTELAGSLGLLEAEANFRLDRPDVALADLRRLRENYPRSDAAVQSYLVEADAYESRNQLVEAQQLLTRVADDFADHRYAPHALFEAALNAERRGQDAYYQEAYNLLERLVRDYPRSDLLFAARLKQGDLLRLLNQFAAAQQTYEWLINNRGQHRDVLRAQLALADCHAAQGANDVSHQESALSIYERLRDLPNAPIEIRIEAGFKLGNGLVRRGGEAAGRGRAQWWQVATTFLTDAGTDVVLGPRGRYWMARLLLELGAAYEGAGQAEAALDAYELLLAHGLPGGSAARQRLLRLRGGSPAVDAVN